MAGNSSKTPEFVLIPFDLLQADLKPMEFKVLICLYSFRNKTTNTAWPKLEQLAGRLGKPESYAPEISRVISTLRKKGYLKTSRKFGGRNQYEMCLPNIVENPQECISETVTAPEAPENTGLQAVDSCQGTNIVEIPQNREIPQDNIVEIPQDNIVEIPQDNIVEKPQVNIAEIPQVHINRERNREVNKLNKQINTCRASEIFDYWKLILNHPTAKFGTKRKTAIERMIKLGYDVDFIKRAILGCSKTLHNMGFDRFTGQQTGSRYDDVELICRNETQVERFETASENPSIEQQVQMLCGKPVIQKQAVAGSTRNRSLQDDLTDTSW